MGKVNRATLSVFSMSPAEKGGVKRFPKKSPEGKKNQTPEHSAIL